MSSDRRMVYAEPNFKPESPEGDRRHGAWPGGDPTSDPTPYSDQYAIGEDDNDDSSGRDAVFAAAAGNENTGVERHPGAEDGALTLIPVDQERKKSSFANYGGRVDVA